MTDKSIILQFGTSRFLQAHVDYFVSHSLKKGLSKAPIIVVQSSNSADGIARVGVMNSNKSYPVKIQGVTKGEIVDTEEQVSSIKGAYQASKDWETIVDVFCEQADYVISNTADQGYLLSKSDHIDSLPPQSFPAKLLVLLHKRYLTNAKPITIMPCELVPNNALVLKDIILSLAASWHLDVLFVTWLKTQCLWVNSLVDRIVSEPIEPLGAVAEPYALWAIENQPGLVLPCQHEAIRLVDKLLPLETLKLYVLNLSHTYIVNLWLNAKALQRIDNSVLTVKDAMEHSYLRAKLEEVLKTEVIPVLHAMNLGEDVEGYVSSVIERFSNPFLQHKLADIAQNHHEKIERRILPVVLKAAEVLPQLHLPNLKQCIIDNGLAAKL